MKKVLFAGASSFFGLAEISKMLLSYDINASYIETSNMVKYLNHEDTGIVLIKENISTDYDSIIPLNEYWVSRCKEANIPNISKIAFNASRSKIELSDVISKNNLDTCEYRSIDEELVKEIYLKNKKYIIKPEGMYSGHGIFILNKKNLHLLEDFCREAVLIKDTTKDVLNIKKTKPVCFQYIDGDEYSADVFFYRGKCNIVRVCKKRIRIINNKPCVLGYLLLYHDKFDAILRKWCYALFSENDISFAQFDFLVENQTNKIIPIDFSCRVGGGLKNLFAAGNNNVYLRAMESAVSGAESNAANQKYNCQLNIIPEKEGIVKSNEYKVVDGIVYVKKRKNDMVTQEYASASNRIIELILNVDSEEAFEANADKCVIGNAYIESIKEACFRFIKFALIFGEIKFNEKRLLTELDKINTYQDIENISYNDELYDWKSSLVYNLCGFKEYDECSLNMPNSSSYILFAPGQFHKEYIKHIFLSDLYTLEKFNIFFSRKLVAHIYGGFPWFESYVKFCTELDIIDKKTICYRITKKDGSDVLRELIEYKNKFRKENMSHILRKEYENEFPGIVNPFHTPNPIENHLHSARILEEIERCQDI